MDSTQQQDSGPVNFCENTYALSCSGSLYSWKCLNSAVLEQLYPRAGLKDHQLTPRNHQNKRSSREFQRAPHLISCVVIWCNSPGSHVCVQSGSEPKQAAHFFLLCLPVLGRGLGSKEGKFKAGRKRTREAEERLRGKWLKLKRSRQPKKKCWEERGWERHREWTPTQNFLRGKRKRTERLCGLMSWMIGFLSSPTPLNSSPREFFGHSFSISWGTDELLRLITVFITCFLQYQCMDSILSGGILAGNLPQHTVQMDNSFISLEMSAFLIQMLELLLSDL